MSEENMFAEGDTVRIMRGAFAAVVGRVLTIDHKRARLKVRVDLKVTTDADSQTLDLGFRDVEKVRFYYDTP